MADDDNEIHREYYTKNTNSAISATRSEHLEDHHILTVTDTQSNALPPNPFILSFQNLTYAIRINKKLSCPSFFTTATTGNTEQRVLLNGISGQAIEGEIMAVLGASGSGKSTLIDALANRISKESLGGSIKLNGEEVIDSNLNSMSAYVMQDDLLLPMLTVEETLMFSAEFRLPRALSKSQKKSRVEALIDQLGLRAVAKTIIGDEGHRGVSGGERKRVSIGTDIIHDPIILFLDEPTSGLDSTSAYKVVQVLQRIAQSGSIVIMSIHQPSYRILSLLDRLILLSIGQTVYSGSPGNLPEFFAEFGRPIPENENRAEFALDLIRELEDSFEEGASSLAEFNQSWHDKRVKCLETESNSTLCLSSSLHDAIKASISKSKLVSGGTGTTTSMTTSSSSFDEANNNLNPTSSSSSSSIQKYANPFWIEAYVIGKRSFVNSRRMPEVFGVRLVAILITSILLATIFWNLEDSPKGAKERLAFIAFAMSTAFYTCAETLPRFLQERYIYMRETRYNAYRRSSYVLSNAIISIPSLLILSLIFAAVTFWSVGLSGGSSGFLYYFCIIVASFWAGSSFVTFLSGLVPDVVTGYTVSLAILSYYVLFSGFFIIRDRIPVYWIWYHYISLVKYPYEGSLHNEFDDPNKCFGRGVQMFDETLFQSLPEQVKLDLLKSMGDALGNSITSTTCILKGSDVLNQAGINELSKWNCLLITIAWGLLFRFLFYMALLLRSRNRS